MKITKIIVAFICFLSFSVSASSEQNVALKNYVDNLISEGYKIVQNPKLSESEKFKKSSDIIKDNLHLDWMAQYTLGRNKRSLSEQKIQEFINIYSKFIVNAYADLSKYYNGEQAVVKKISQINDTMFIVNMEIVKTGSTSPVKVDYLIHVVHDSNKTTYKVADVITEGVSILNSQKAEFNSIITNQGIDALIADLKEKVKRKEEEKK